MIVQIPEGFTPWDGKAFPVSPSTEVEVMHADGSISSSLARDLCWLNSEDEYRIIAYRVLQEEKPKMKIPEGFTPCEGGECPVPGERVDVILRNGNRGPCTATALKWSHSGSDGDIFAYRVIEEEKPQRANDIQVGGNHYKDAGVQPWEVIDTWPLDQRIGFYRGNALKYTMRMGTKDEQLTEIKKAQHYLQKLVEVLEEQKGSA